MSAWIWIVLVACTTAVIIVTGYIGNRIVDRMSDSVRNSAVRRRNAMQPPKSESLKDRMEQQSR